MLLSHLVADAIREIDVSGAGPFDLLAPVAANPVALQVVAVEVVAGSGSLTFGSAVDAGSVVTGLVPGSLVQIATRTITAKSGVTNVRVYYKA